MKEAEELAVVLGDAALFDKLVHSGLPEGGDLHVVSKDVATEGNSAAVVIAFSAQLPDGSIATVQSVTTVRLFLAAAAALLGRYDEDGVLRSRGN